MNLHFFHTTTAIVRPMNRATINIPVNIGVRSSSNFVAILGLAIVRVLLEVFTI